MFTQDHSGCYVARFNCTKLGAQRPAGRFKAFFKFQIKLRAEKKSSENVDQWLDSEYTLKVDSISS